MAAVVQALRSSRSRSPSPSVDPDDDGSLAEVMREVGAVLGSDALIVSWHERGGTAPVLLFADGTGAEAHPEGAVEPPRGRSSLSSGAGTLSSWHLSDGPSPGGELTASIDTEDGVVTIVGRFSRLGAATRARAQDAAGHLLPMVRPFVRLWAARRNLLSRLRGVTAAVNQSDLATLLVDRQGQLLFANAAAEALLLQADGIRRQGKLLSGGQLADTLRFQATVEHVITQREGQGPDRGGPVIALTRRGRRPLLAAVIADDAALDQNGESAAIIYLCDPDQDLTRLVEPVCKLYGLSPVETRLACQLARGISLAEAAEAMHLREQTARSYLKQVFQKTNTRRQAELVWLMLKSSVHTMSATFGQTR